MLLLNLNKHTLTQSQQWIQLFQKNSTCCAFYLFFCACVHSNRNEWQISYRFVCVCKTRSPPYKRSIQAHIWTHIMQKMKSIVHIIIFIITPLKSLLDARFDVQASKSKREWKKEWTNGGKCDFFVLDLVANEIDWLHAEKQQQHSSFHAKEYIRKL